MSITEDLYGQTPEQLDAELAAHRADKAHLIDFAKRTGEKRDLAIADMVHKGGDLVGLELPPVIADVLSYVRRAASLAKILPIGDERVHQLLNDIDDVVQPVARALGVK